MNHFEGKRETDCLRLTLNKWGRKGQEEEVDGDNQFMDEIFVYIYLFLNTMESQPSFLQS